MKKGIRLFVTVLLILSMTGCGSNVSSYRAVGLVRTNSATAASMRFRMLDGRMVFRLKSTGEGTLWYSAKLESGEAAVYYECNGVGTELFSLSGGEELDAQGGQIEAGVVYIIVETHGSCRNGELRIGLSG